MISAIEKYKDKFSNLTSDEKHDLFSSIASFEIEGITITEEMIDNAIKILKGEVTGKELNDKYIKSLANRKESK